MKREDARVLLYSYREEEERRRRRRCFTPFWVACCCCFFALAVLATVLATTLTAAARTNHKCAYGAWTYWSPTCYELSAGVYRQLRTRATTTPNLSGCEQQTEQRACNTSACVTYVLYGSPEYECSYNSTTHLCENSTSTITTTVYCMTNASNTALNMYHATQGQVFAVNTTEYTGECIPVCPIANSLIVPSPDVMPVPSSIPECTYAGWTPWSSTCLDNDGVYTVIRTRVPDPFYSWCTDTSERKACGSTSGCATNTLITASQPQCEYASNGTCLSSTLTEHLTSVCLTNATDYEHYVAAHDWVTVTVNVSAFSPCDAACAPFSEPIPSPAMPSPSAMTPVPTPSPGCIPSASSWSLLCIETAPDVYERYRTVTEADCTIATEFASCSPWLDNFGCTTFDISYWNVTCYYDELNECANMSGVGNTTFYCYSNASVSIDDYIPLVDYGGWTYFWLPGFTPCLSICPESGSGIIPVFYTNTSYNVTAFVVCTPPEYYDATTLSCEECTNTSATTIGFINYNTGACEQVPRCNDYNPCTGDHVLSDGSCFFVPITQNMPGEVGASCNTFVGSLDLNFNLNPELNSTGPLCPTNGTLVGTYNYATQQCVYVEPTAAPLLLSSCQIDVSATSASSQTLDGDWTCGVDTNKVCVNDTCITPERTRCYYDLTVWADWEQQVSTTEYTDDTWCYDYFLEDWPGKLNTLAQDAACMPHKCEDTVTGCAICPKPQYVGQFTSPDNCVCCGVGLATCKPGYYCLLGLCLPNP